MKNVYKRVLSLFSGIAIGVLSMSAYTPESGEAVFSYDPNPFGGGQGGFGVGNGDGHFDVAIKLESSVFKGSKIKGLLVPFGDTDFLMDMEAWVSTNLNFNNSDDCVHTPDIQKKSFFYSNTNEDKSVPGFAEVMFDTPVEIGNSDLYVGYTFTVAEHNSGNDIPILVYPKAGYEGASLYVQTEGWTWSDVAKMGYTWSSCLCVILESPEAGLSIKPIEPIYTQASTDTTVPVSVYRTGSDKVTSIEYDVLIDGQLSTYTYKVPAGTVLNSAENITYPAYSFPVTLPKLYSKGEHNLRITITNVNGKPNGSPNNIVNTKVRVSDFLPTKRVLLEEMTCTACTYCTRGTYAMNLMRRLHPEDCVGIVYHNSMQWGGSGEPMHVLELSDVPFKTSGGNPTIFADRKYDTADFYSTYISSTISFGVNEAWEKAVEDPAPAGLEVSAVWKDEDKEELEVTGTARFTSDYENADQFKMELVLLHDGMHGAGVYWAQRNYYSGIKSVSNEPEWLEICNAPSTIEGMHFQEVYIGSASGHTKGVENSIPAKVREGEAVSFSHTFKMSELKNLTDKSVVQDKNALRVVAILINKDGKAANAAENKVPGYNYVKPGGGSGVSETESFAEVVPVGYYDINGRQLTNPTSGVIIVKYSDGSVRKVLLNK